jgi:hypothetical protein
MRARTRTITGAGATTRVRFASILCALGAAAVLLVGAGSADAFGTGTVTIQTKASPSVSIGGSISDSAQVLGSAGGGGGLGLGPVPTGTLVFKLYGPNDTTCSMSPVYTSAPIALVSQAGVVATASSGSYTPPAGAAGSYQFVDSYSGDANYQPSATSCGTSSETVQVTDVTPTLSTVASPSTVALGGGPLTDTATLSGGKAPTGSITFLLFPPTDPTCSGNLVDAKSTVPVSNPSSIVSQPFTPSVAGTYHWIAYYSGDVHNGAVDGACSDPGEAVVVTPAPAGTAPSGTSPSSSSPSAGSGGANAACNPVATANAVLAGVAATLTGQSASFENSCSAGLRIVLRAKEIRPGDLGYPRHDGYTTMANDLTHISPTVPAVNFSLSQAGLTLRAYALDHNRSLIAFLIVHVRPDKTSSATEAIEILTLS